MLRISRVLIELYSSIENRPTAEELERLELPWCWKSYSVRFDENKFR